MYFSYVVSLWFSFVVSLEFSFVVSLWCSFVRCPIFDCCQAEWLGNGPQPIVFRVLYPPPEEEEEAFDFPKFLLFVFFSIILTLFSVKMVWVLVWTVSIVLLSDVGSAPPCNSVIHCQIVLRTLEVSQS